MLHWTIIIIPPTIIMFAYYTSVRSGQIRNVSSARISMPGQVMRYCWHLVVVVTIVTGKEIKVVLILEVKPHKLLRIP